MDKLLLINTIHNETLQKHRTKDFLITQKITIPKPLLFQWKLVKNTNNKTFLYKTNYHGINTILHYIFLQKQINPNNKFIKEIDEWFKNILFNEDIKGCVLYYEGSNISMTLEHTYYININ